MYVCVYVIYIYIERERERERERVVRVCARATVYVIVNICRSRFGSVLFELLSLLVQKYKY